MNLWAVTSFKNSASFLGFALESLRQQSDRRWKLVLINDRSADASPEIAKEFMLQNPEHVFYLDKIPDSANRVSHFEMVAEAIEKMESDDWFFFLDSDDVLCHQAVEAFHNAILGNPKAEFAYADFQFMDITGEKFYPSPCAASSHVTFERLMKELCIHRPVFIKKCLYDYVGGIDRKMVRAADYDLNLRCLKEVPARMVANIPGVHYHYRQHSLQVSRNRSEQLHWARYAREKHD